MSIFTYVLSILLGFHIQSFSSPTPCKLPKTSNEISMLLLIDTPSVSGGVFLIEIVHDLTPGIAEIKAGQVCLNLPTTRNQLIPVPVPTTAGLMLQHLE